ncbi:hypothetical protein [Celeribacter baekdonensis]|uniref:hypothetical protein n=1 Tax=Celeribacter baekdonensis TaxID=875171 RepID=UPI0030D771B0
MGTHMMMQESLSDTVEQAQAQTVSMRQAAILRAARLPDAPLAMPRQLIERPLAEAVANTPLLSRLIGSFASGVGRAARGR